MSRLLRTGLATAAASTLTVLLVATSAQADVARHADRRHDVQHFSGNHLSPAPRVADPDITRVTVRHGATRVTIRLALRDVTRTTKATTAQIVTPRRTFDVLAMHPARAVTIFPESGNPNYSCPRATAARHLGRNVIVLSVPRRCLGNPRWVRVGVGVLSWRSNLTKGWADQGFGGRIINGDSELALGRRVHSS